MSAHPQFKAAYDMGVYGRPNLGRLAIEAAKEFGAQTVFCVSNKEATKVIVNTCLAKEIPAYGTT